MEVDQTGFDMNAMRDWGTLCMIIVEAINGFDF